ncbi:MAG TPA: RNA polymerase sigma factor [Phycisphaerales bacterium]|nr:RNA polymerase sigma factor [Phycisphaerales bacterium]
MTSAAPNSPNSNDPVAMLCELAAGGDADATTKLLSMHHGRLVGFAKRKIGVDWQGKIETDDILQEAYIDVFKGIATFKYQGEDSFYHWATKIIDHRFIDHARHWRRKKRDVSREMGQGGGGPNVSRHDTLLDRCLPDSVTASRIMRREEATAALMACIAKLPEDYQKVVTRLYLEEADLAEVAKEMDRSPDAVRRLASRALEHLEACVGKASRYLSGEG